MNKQSGFSLIELMITVIVLTIVTSIALPSYQEHVKRSHRVDATSALLRVAQEQEKFYIQNNGYTTDLADLNIDGTIEDYYSLTISSNDLTQDFLASATAKSGGPQEGDGKCQTFTLDSTGEQTATGSGGDNTEICW